MNQVQVQATGDVTTVWDKLWKAAHQVGSVEHVEGQNAVLVQLTSDTAPVTIRMSVEADTAFLSTVSFESQEDLLTGHGQAAVHRVRELLHEAAAQPLSPAPPGPRPRGQERGPLVNWFTSRWSGEPSTRRTRFRVIVIVIAAIVVLNVTIRLPGVGGKSDEYKAGQSEGQQQGSLQPANFPIPRLGIELACDTQADNRDLSGGGKDDFVEGCLDAYIDAMPASSRPR